MLRQILNGVSHVDNSCKKVAKVRLGKVAKGGAFVNLDVFKGCLL